MSSVSPSPMGLSLPARYCSLQNARTCSLLCLERVFPAICRFWLTPSPFISEALPSYAAHCLGLQRFSGVTERPSV